MRSRKLSISTTIVRTGKRAQPKPPEKSSDATRPTQVQTAAQPENADCQHLRRCHLCLQVSQGPEFVRRCLNCGVAFNPFYFFSPSMVYIGADEVRSATPKGTFRALIGFTALWTDADE